MVSFAVQRENMVESQVRTADVVDRRIIRAMLEIPREAFVPEDVQALAYMDGDVPITQSQSRFMMAPGVHAKLIQFLEIEDNAVVLDVGCGTGYGSAIMARLAQTVVGLESDPAIAESATKILSELGVDNVVIVIGELTAGWPSEGPYDAILLNGSVPEVPSVLLEQLKDGGRLAAIEADEGVSRARIWQRSGKTVSARTVFDAAAKPLPGFERKPEFVF